MSYPFLNRREGSGLEIMGYAGENLPTHNVVYLDNVGLWRLADGDVMARMPVVGFTKEPIPNGQRGTILLHGMIGFATWTWTPGGILYASTIAGEMTQIVPANAQELGVAYETGDVIYFHPGFRGYPAGAGGGVTVRVNTGADVGTRPRLNFIDGAGIAITAVDDAVGGEVDITISDACLLLEGATAYVGFDTCKTVYTNYFLCNGVADDVQIQQAIDYTNGLGGGRVLLMRGIYVVNASILHRSNVALLGVDQYSTIIRLAAGVTLGTTPIILFEDGGNVELGHLEIDGNDGNGSTCRGIEWNVGVDEGLNRMYVHDIYLHNTTSYGAYFRATAPQPQSKLDIERIYVYDCAHYGVHVRGGINQLVFRDSTVDKCLSVIFDINVPVRYLITGCTFKDSDGDATTNGSGLRIAGGGFGGKISDCYAYNNNYAGFLISRGDGVVLDNCTAYLNGQHAPQAGFKTGNAGTKNVTFIDCVSYDNTGSGFSGSDDSRFIRVLNSIAHNNDLDGIYFPYGMSAAIGNYLYNNGQGGTANRQNGILVGAIAGSCDDCVIKNNTIWDDQGVETQIVCIMLNNADDTLIVGNKLPDCALGLNVFNNTCDRTVVDSNDFYGCTTDVSDTGTNTRYGGNKDQAGNWDENIEP